MTNEELLTELKQFVDGRIGQSESLLRDELSTRIKQSEDLLREELADLKTHVDEHLDAIAG